MTGPFITIALAAFLTSGANAESVEKKAKAKGPAFKHAEIFKKLDTNSDGSVSLEEFKKLPDVMPKPKTEKGTKGKIDLEKVFKHLDANSDGKLTLKEFEEFGKKAKAAAAKKKAK